MRNSDQTAYLVWMCQVGIRKESNVTADFRKRSVGKKSGPTRVTTTTHVWPNRIFWSKSRSVGQCLPRGPQTALPETGLEQILQAVILTLQLNQAYRTTFFEVISYLNYSGGVFQHHP